MANKNDKIKVAYSLATLEAEADKRTNKEPLQIALKDNKVISFGNPQDGMDGFELLDLLDENSNPDPIAILKASLSEADFELLKANKPSIQALTKLIQMVSEHFGAAASEDAPKS